MKPTPAEIFAANREVDEEMLARFERMKDPRSRYVVAITPRSGSSYLCDVLRRTAVFGHPDERLNANFIPNILEKIPARDADTYLRNSFRQTRTANGISGIKASWFQFRNFASSMVAPEKLQHCKFIYLFRRDSILQAISLYRATESGVFHTNIRHSGESRSRLAELEYDFTKILYWHDHILVQERGWRKYFETTGINPLALTYEDMLDDLPCTLRRIASHVGVRQEKARVPAAESVFEKLSGSTSIEWAARFLLEREQQHGESNPS